MAIKPNLASQYYFGVGDTIVFNMELKHNASATAEPVNTLIIVLVSTYLSFTTSSVEAGFLTGTGLSATKNAVGEGVSLTVSGTFTSSHILSANITTTVKNSIGPLSNLVLNARLTATETGSGDAVSYNKSSEPVVYAVFPTVNLTRDTSAGKFIALNFRL